MSWKHRAALAASAVLLVMGGIAAPALASPPTAWAQQGSGFEQFTPDGFGDTYTLSTSEANTLAALAKPYSNSAVVVTFGFVNNTDASVSITYLGVNGPSHGEGYLNTSVQAVQPRGVYYNSVIIVDPGLWNVVIGLSNGKSLTWYFNTEKLLGSSYGIDAFTGIAEYSSVGEPVLVEPPLAGPEQIQGVVLNIGDDAGTEDGTCQVSLPFVIEPGTCLAQSNSSGLYSVRPVVEAPQQTSLANWTPGGYVAAVDWFGIVDTSIGSTPIGPLPELDVVPFLYTVPGALPASTSVSVPSGSKSAPINFTVGANSGLDVTQASFTGTDASDFTVSLPSHRTAPTGGGTWQVATVSLATTTPGSYSADLVLEFDPNGQTFSETIPVSGSVPATATGTTSSSSTSGSSGTTSTTPPSPPVVVTPPPPEPVAVGETCGAAGTEVQIWGDDLAGSTVRFANATSGVVTMLSPTEAEATVPHAIDGLGPITVIGPGGQAVQVPGVTWNPACATQTMSWTTPAGPGQVTLHVVLISSSSASHCLSGKTIVVLGREGEQVAKVETTATPITLVLPVFEGPFTAVFDGDARCGPSQSEPVA